jgi:endonuclease/exonuclease/phosphatase family metal-dependent hydrolase
MHPSGAGASQADIVGNASPNPYWSEVMAKKATKKASRKAPARAGKKKTGRPANPTRTNDHIADMIDGLIADNNLVPEALRGTDRYLDIITWNIRYFNARDAKRVERIASLMAQLNADIFVLQEIEDGSLDYVAEILIDSGAGLYKEAYGTTGGDQRVAFLYDMEFVRAKQEIVELFPDRPRVSQTGRKEIFPRLPLHAEMTGIARPGQGGVEMFDFNLLGLHLKSQRPDQTGDDGSPQRRMAGERLAAWVREEVGNEPDIIMAGDWNAQADRREWEAIRKLEEEDMARFVARNPGGEASHFFKSGEGSRLDLVLVTDSAEDNAVDPISRVIHWNQALQNRTKLRAMIETISDHMPVLSRFYFHERD